MREKAPGVWELRAPLDPDPVTGERRRISRTFRGTKRDAQTALAELVVEAGKTRAGGGRTFGVLLDEWWKRKEKELSPTTLHEYRRVLEKTWRADLGDVPLDDLKASHLQGVVDRLQAGGLSAPAIERQFAVARGALRLGERLEWVVRSPHDRVVKPSDNRDSPDDPTAVELLAVLKAANARDPGLGLLLRVAAGFGCRRGELCGLRWRDIDLERGVATVRKNVVVVADRPPGADPRKRYPRKVIVKDPKRGKKPKLTIDPDTVALLRVWRAHVDALAQDAGVKVAKDAFLFSDTPTRSSPLMPDWITRAFASAAEEAGVTAHLHQLRHLNASTMLAAGVPLAVASRRVGHAKQSTTTDMYGDVVMGDDAGAAAAIGAMLSGITPALPGLPAGNGAAAGVPGAGDPQQPAG